MSFRPEADTPLPPPPYERNAPADRLRAILAAQPDIVVLQGADDRYLEVYCPDPSLLIAPPSAFLGKTHRDLFPPYLVRLVNELLAAARLTSELATAEYHVDMPDGRRWYEARAVSAGGGQVLTIVRDVTDRKTAEDHLRERDRLLTALFDDSPLGVQVFAADGTSVRMNPAKQRLLGLPSVDYGVGVYNHRTDPALAGTPVPAAFEKALGGEVATVFGVEVDYSGPDCPWDVGRPKQVLDCWLYPLYGETGRPEAVVTINQDVTERRNLEEQLRQAQKLEAVGHLSAGVAHDFNNILTAVRGFADVLRGTLAAGHPGRDMADEIARAADRGAALTRQLLAFGRQQVVRVQVLDLNAVLADLARLLARLLGEDVALDARLAADPQPVRADRGQLEQIVVNLAVNARDAMPQGGRLTVTTETVEPDDDARRRSAAPPGRYVRLSVSDTGTGMSDEVKARLFEPFFTTKDVGKGTGLGLATVYGIARQAAGFVTVASEPGMGSRFDVYLPRADDAPAAGPRSGLLRLPTTAGSETVLVVEDDDAVRSLTTLVLSAAGYAVRTAADGPAALAACDELDGELDLVVTDVVMPGMGGRELAERLAERYPRLKVVFLSGYTADTVLRHGVAEDRVAFLQKPFTPDKLTAFVRQVLDRP